jgi:hypothetical protein
MSRRSVAAYLSESTCPRCGAGRAADQRYCVECGLRLPVATGALAAWRRSWTRTFGWYPGDWVWLTLLAGVVAAAGAGVALHLGHRHVTSSAATTYVAPTPRAVTPARPTGASGHTSWPPQLDAWTVILVSSPVANGKAPARQVALRAARDHLPQVGVLDSSRFGSLHPGYFVVFSGVYGASGDAQAALQTVRARGFGAAYVTRVAP